MFLKKGLRSLSRFSRICIKMQERFLPCSRKLSKKCKIQTKTGTGNVNEKQFFQTLVDRMVKKFLQNGNSVKEILNDFQIIDDFLSPKTDDNMSLDEMSVKQVARYFNLLERTALCDFRSWNIHSMLQRTIKIIPVATAEYERRFFLNE